jgi:hypothetical protein
VIGTAILLPRRMRRIHGRADETGHDLSYADSLSSRTSRKEFESALKVRQYSPGRLEDNLEECFCCTPLSGQPRAGCLPLPVR